MKKILVACGSGVATSTAVNAKIKGILDEHGFRNQYKITQCKVSEAAAQSASFDFLISTTQKPSNLHCDFVSGVPFLTGVNLKPTVDKIIELMNK